MTVCYNCFSFNAVRKLYVLCLYRSTCKRKITEITPRKIQNGTSLIKWQKSWKLKHIKRIVEKRSYSWRGARHGYVVFCKRCLYGEGFLWFSVNMVTNTYLNPCHFNFYSILNRQSLHIFLSYINDNTVMLAHWRLAWSGS